MKLLALLTCTTLIACGGNSSGPDAAATIDASADAAATIDASRADAHPGACADPGALPIYLDRAGVTMSPGAENPGANTSTILNGTVVIGPYGQADASWTSLMACVTTALEPFDVHVTDVDPGNVPQIEVVITNDRSSAVIGIANQPATSPFACRVIKPSVHFIFPSELANPSPNTLCRLVAQAVGHAAGLDYETGCGAMGYSLTCPDAPVFADAAATCGTSAPATCCAGGPTHDAFTIMTAAFGACP